MSLNSTLVVAFPSRSHSLEMELLSADSIQDRRKGDMSLSLSLSYTCSIEQKNRNFSEEGNLFPKYVDTHLVIYKDYA